METPEVPSNDISNLSDSDIIIEVLKTKRHLFEVLMRRYNRRLYRVARSILGDGSEAEDVAQEAWVQAYCKLAQYAGAASFSTWVSKIAAHEALARLRRRAREAALKSDSVPGAQPFRRRAYSDDPEKLAFAHEVHNILETALDALADQYRSVFVLRCIEHLSAGETAAVLGLSESVVRTRLHRARLILRRSVGSRLGQLPSDLYRFPAPRCNRIVDTVNHRLTASLNVAREIHGSDKPG